jgi:hypothetical protein
MVSSGNHVISSTGESIAFGTPERLAHLRHKADLLEATESIAKKMSRNVKVAEPGQHINWRIDSRSFLKADPSRKVPPGVETYSAGWFAQGHSVG